MASLGEPRHAHDLCNTEKDEGQYCSGSWHRLQRGSRCAKKWDAAHATRELMLKESETAPFRAAQESASCLLLCVCVCRSVALIEGGSYEKGHISYFAMPLQHKTKLSYTCLSDDDRSQRMW